MARLATEDFENEAVGNYNGGSIFSGPQEFTPGRVQVVSSPTRLGSRALRCQVHDGDKAAGSGSGERAEVCCGSSGLSNSTPNGLVRWYAVSVRFPNEFNPTPGTEWNHIWQFHQSGDTSFVAAQPNQLWPISSNGADIKMINYGGTSNNANRRDFTIVSNFQRNVWYDFEFGVCWSSDSTGWIEFWVNNVQVIPKTFTPTRYTATGTYMKAGHYRLTNGAPTSTIYHDEFRIGETRADVTLYGSDPTPPGGGRGGLYFLTPNEVVDIIPKLGTAPYAGAWANELAYANARLNYSPNPPSPNGDYGSVWQNVYTPGFNDGHAAHSLAFAYLMTGNTAYADRALLILNDWRTTYSHPPGIGGGVQPGHMVAEPIGPMIKMCMAIDMLRNYMTASNLLQFQTWAAQWINRGKTNADSSRNSPWVASTTIGGETYSAVWAGNSPLGQIAMAVWCAAVTGGTTLTSILDWVTSHTTSGGHQYHWDSILDDMIITVNHTSHTGWPETNLTPHASSTAIGETIEGHGRESGDYGLFGWVDMLLVADVAKHAGYPVNFFTRVTPAGRTLADVARFYGPKIMAADDSLFASFYGSGHDPDDGNPSTHRSAFELLRKNLPTDHAMYDFVDDAVLWGGNAVREDNYWVHIARYTPTIIASSEVVQSPDATIATNTRDRRFGKTTVGASRNGFTENNKRGSKFATGLQAGEEGDLYDIHVWNEGFNDGFTQKLSVAVYADDGGSGLPGTKLGECDVEIDRSGSAAAAWTKITCSSPIRFTGANVWLVVGSGATTNTLRYATDAVTGGLVIGGDTYGTFPHLADPFGAASLSNLEMSICADYEVVAGTPGGGGDVTAPVLIAARASGLRITLDYDEPLNLTSEPLTTDYALTVNGVSRQIVDVAIVGSDVELTLPTVIDVDDVITLSYTRVATREVEDLAGNLAANFSGLTITNEAIPVLPSRIVTDARAITDDRVIDGEKNDQTIGGGV